ncbi:Phytoene desaturase [Fulvia fulva]|uniref:Phytoene desaturase n=1 Tax=Passalora fulva TaxID=5499 RepID=A0A9Q8PM91_PASFU|nr:Phytoene desaturase [Fulvia fulva]KAK4609195.1 Phytoene desaturase [Fulvia fulva]KAK4609834.1 Phytoene desaturase [Fulvia fulva]UJO25214.1 Phytoene desaturase [Fulvia fulva]WPV22667.1 Phytoene desaturase [Fulvia fulva]WPV37680.1 Phytoene desaturase [Fulvia fulva]
MVFASLSFPPAPLPCIVDLACQDLPPRFHHHFHNATTDNYHIHGAYRISQMAPNATPQKTALIIGAGVGGVSTAARLAHAGFRVTVLEKNSFTGGRCSLLYADGHRFDQGPSLLLLPDLFRRTFAELGTSLQEEGVELVKCEPNYIVHFHDGEKFRLSSDLSVMKGEVERWEGKSGYERYLGFLGEAHRHYELSVREVLLRNFYGVVSMLRPEFLRHLIELHPFESIWTRASKYFWTERLRRVFTFGSMYMGMSPFDAPGTYSLLQYTELAEGIWYPVGGFHKVVEALVGVGERKGVEFRMSTPVRRILLDASGSKTEGVELESGEVLKADVVVNNSDLVYAYNNLLPQSESAKKAAYAEALEKRPGSCSSISFYWALDRKVPELEAHNIFLADEYRESFDSIFQKHLIPDEPSFYVNVPSRVDPTAAPEGKDTVVVLVPVGHLVDDERSRYENTSNGTATSNGHLKDASPSNQTGFTPTSTQNWPSMIALARKTILTTIATRTGVDLTPLISTELTNDPTTWRSRFNLDKGAILGLSHSFFNVLCFRPSTKARRAGPLDDLTRGLGPLGTVVQVVGDAFRGEGRFSLLALTPQYCK